MHRIATLHSDSALVAHLTECSLCSHAECRLLHPFQTAAAVSQTASITYSLLVHLPNGFSRAVVQLKPTLTAGELTSLRAGVENSALRERISVSTVFAQVDCQQSN